MDWSQRLRSPEPSPALARLERARAVLAGRDDAGNQTHPSMFDEGIISFAHGEGLRRPHASVIQSAAELLESPESWPIENYMFLQRHNALDEAIADSFIAAGVPAAIAGNIVVDAGTTRLALAFLQLATRPGDTIVTGPSFYHAIARWCGYLGLCLEIAPTSAKSDFRLTASDLESWWRGRPADVVSRPPLLFLFNPNLTGGVSTEEELAGIARFLRRHDLIAVEDTNFAGLEFAPHFAGKRLAHFAPERVFTLAGGSKVHGLANIRIGWGCGAPDLIAALDRFVETSAATIPHIARVMAATALRAPSSYGRINRAESARRAALIAELAAGVSQRVRVATGIDADVIRLGHAASAGHSVLLDFNALLGLRTPEGETLADSIDLARYLLGHAGTAFSPGLSIGWGGCLLRCNFASVGAKETYPSAGKAERSIRTEPRCSVERLDPDLMLQAEIEAGFANARRIIEQAFRERVEPALIRLIQDNLRAPVENPALVALG